MSALPCPVHDACGGCAWMPQALDDQAEQKRRRLSELLGRAPDDWIPSPRSLGYRARVALQIGPRGAVGYHRPRSHELAQIPSCAIARPELQAALDALRAQPPGPGLERVELRSDGARVVLHVSSERRAGKAARSSAMALAWPDVALDGRRVKGDPTLTLEVAGITHRVSPGSFYQVNLEVNARLVERVRELVLPLAPAGLLDLYAGLGNLSLPLAAAGVRSTLIEASPASSGDAQRTARALGLPVEVVKADAGRLEAGARFFDVALLDPPRAGAPGLIPKLLVTRPRALLYVSCNPSTLARDLKPALAAGYRLEHLAGFDMFPHTPHVEALAWLLRG